MSCSKRADGFVRKPEKHLFLRVFNEFSLFFYCLFLRFFAIDFCAKDIFKTQWLIKKIWVFTDAFKA